jgi:site-specific recombinase XerD
MFRRDDFIDCCISKLGIKLGTAKTYACKLRKVVFKLEKQGFGSLDNALSEHSSEKILSWAEVQKFYKNPRTNRDACSALAKYIKFICCQNLKM